MAIRRNTRGFTLVEILIVVIILGILAAIVIPQFTNASEDARRSSTVSQLQTIRSQIELYKLQHRDEISPLLETGGEPAWDEMTVKTNDDHTTTGTPQFGPYLQAEPVNALTGGYRVVVAADDAAALATTADLSGTTAATRDGFVYSQATGKIWAYDKDGAVLTEN